MATPPGQATHHPLIRSKDILFPETKYPESIENMKKEVEDLAEKLWELEEQCAELCKQHKEAGNRFARELIEFYKQTNPHLASLTIDDVMSAQAVQEVRIRANDDPKDIRKKY